MLDVSTLVQLWPYGSVFFVSFDNKVSVLFVNIWVAVYVLRV